MADAPATHMEVEVRLWDRAVGLVRQLGDGRVLFEWTDEFRRTGPELSPIRLPTSLEGPHSFEELRGRSAFEGLPGVLADALPDAFGKSVMGAYYASTGHPELPGSPLGRLLHLGDRALGALTFQPADELPDLPAEPGSLDIQGLAHDARRIVRNAPGVAIREMYRIGSVAGGKRAKVIVHYDPADGTLRSGALPLRAGEIACILKLDGVGGGEQGASGLAPPSYYNRIEAAYGDMAREAGVDMAEIRVLDVDGYAHLLIRRFDLGGGTRLHQHTFGGMLHIDYNEPGAASYEDYFRTIQRLAMGADSLAQAFRRMVFNVLAVNQDDHVKNFSFHMDSRGRWSLTPAYDLTFAHGYGWTAHHQMRIRGKRSGIREGDLLAVAREFGIEDPARTVAEVRSAVADWERHATSYDIPSEGVRVVRREMDEREEELKA